MVLVNGAYGRRDALRILKFYSASCFRHLWMQGGSRTSGHGLRDFLKLEAQHWPIKLKEFVLDSKRAHAAMSRSVPGAAVGTAQLPTS